MASADLFLECAARIGRRLVREAVWEADTCTWEMPVRAGSRGDATSVPAGGGLYGGTAGIGLFLSEFAALAHGAEVREAALGAIRHAVAEGHDLKPAGVGFFAGRVGIAHAAARVGTLLERDDLTLEAERLVAPIADEPLGPNWDVIAGVAGSVAPLLRLADTLGSSTFLTIAERFGDHLIKIAHREPAGWSWPSRYPHHFRHLTGLAHGAAGAGYALLELGTVTGESAYRYAACRAFDYEDQFYDEEAKNWPDFRHRGLGEYVFQNRLPELARRLGDGELPPAYAAEYMLAWCHGAPGIGLTRLRAWELLGDERYRRCAQAAVDTTLASVVRGEANYSFCHGIGGNSETLLYAAKLFDDHRLREQVAQCASAAYDRYEVAGLPWPCGTEDGRRDPGLMLGEAGIGYHYLRLHSDAVPNLLFLTASESLEDGRKPTQREARLRSEDVATFFDGTLRAFNRLGFADPPEPTGSRTGEASPVATVEKWILATIRDEGDLDVRERLLDAFRVDRERLELLREAVDFSAPFVEGLARSRRVADVENGILALAPSVRMVEVQYDWDAWLTDTAGPKGASGPGSVVLLQRTRSRVKVERLSEFASRVLGAFRIPNTLDGAVSEVVEALGGPQSEEMTGLRRAVREQVEHAYNAMILLEVDPAEPGAQAIRANAAMAPVQGRT